MCFKCTDFWAETLCTLLDRCQCLNGPCCFLHQSSSFYHPWKRK